MLICCLAGSLCQGKNKANENKTGGGGAGVTSLSNIHKAKNREVKEQTARKGRGSRQSIPGMIAAIIIIISMCRCRLVIRDPIIKLIVEDAEF